jgi:hypothetical protein
MSKLIDAALAEDPIAFKREFADAMKSRIEDLQSQRSTEIAQSIQVDGEETAEQD